MKKILIGLALLPLAGCISFGAKPPNALLTLSSAEQVPVGQTQSSAGARTVTIQVPTVPQALAPGPWLRPALELERALRLWTLLAR